MKANNIQIDIDNAKLEKMKAKISIVPRSMEGVELNNEVALVKLNNYREEGQPANAAPALSTKNSSPMKSESAPNAQALTNNSAAPEGEGEEQAELQFQPDKIPLKIPLVKPDACTEGTCIVYHSEA